MPRFVVEFASFMIVSCLLQASSLSEGAVHVQACLDRHNQYRAQHGANPLAWDTYLEKHALEWAKNLNKTGRLYTDPQKKYGEQEGENLFLAASGVVTCEDAVEFWMKEQSQYRAVEACDNPPVYSPPGTSQFTQIIWKSTERMAVASVGNILVARYHPPGNFPEEFDYDVTC